MEFVIKNFESKLYESYLYSTIFNVSTNSKCILNKYFFLPKHHISTVFVGKL